MAKQRHAGGSSPESDAADRSGDEAAEDLTLLLEDSDDEAPQEVTFEESKSEALRSLKEALDTVKREKDVLKEKRRRRQELFQEQKKRRLLSAEVLEEIELSAKKKQKEAEDKGREEEEDEEQEDEAEGAEKQQQKKKKKKTKKKSSTHMRNLKGKYVVATMKAPTPAGFQLQAAQDFIQSRLYGPGCCRTTNNEMLSLQNKRGRDQSAAVQFVKKDWASKSRAKAQKLNKRWIHRQQIVDSGGS